MRAGLGRVDLINNHFRTGGKDPEIPSVIRFKNRKGSKREKKKTTTLPRGPAMMSCERGGIRASEPLLASFLGLRLRIFLTSKEKYPPSTEESPVWSCGSTHSTIQL